MVETSPEIRRDVATVIDDLDFFPDLSVVEHLDLLARAHGQTDPDDMVDAVLEEVQLVPQSGQLPGTLSSGQRRRLALATAFVRPRKLLIMDEPEQRLDTEGVGWLAARLKSERAPGPGHRLRQSRAGAGRARSPPAWWSWEPRADEQSGLSGRTSEAYDAPGLRRKPAAPAGQGPRPQAADQGLAPRSGDEVAVGGLPRRLRRGDRRADDRRHADQRGPQGPDHGVAVQQRLLPVGPYRAAVGRVRPGRCGDPRRRVACSVRYWRRPPRASGCWMRRSTGPGCSDPGWRPACCSPSRAVP